MGLNATTFVPAYTSGEVLTAADLTVTNSGAPVFADAAARDAAFGGTGEKVLAEGQLAYLEDSNIVQYYDGSVWATVGPSADSGLTLVSATTIGTTVSSVTVSGAFSADYDRYLLTIAGGVGSASAGVNLTLGATTANYRFAANYASNSAATGGVFSSAGATSSWQECCYMSTAGISFNMTLINPFLTTRTLAHWQIHGPATSTVNLTVNGGGFLDDATSYTAFTLTTVSGTMTGGTIRVYGYKN